MGRTRQSAKMGRTKFALHLKGFDQQRLVTVEHIVAVIKALPDFHLEGLQSIEYDPDRLSQKAIGYFLAPRVPTALPNLRSRGEYLQDDLRIMIYAFDSEAELLHVLHHEIAHHVYHRVIDGALRKRWVTQIRSSTPATTNYGERNASEDFAETYAIYVLARARLHSTPAKLAFMQTEIFRAAR